MALFVGPSLFRSHFLSCYLDLTLSLSLDSLLSSLPFLHYSIVLRIFHLLPSTSTFLASCSRHSSHSPNAMQAIDRHTSIPHEQTQQLSLKSTYKDTEIDTESFETISVQLSTCLLLKYQMCGRLAC